MNKLYTPERWKQWSERISEKEGRQLSDTGSSIGIARRYPHFDSYVVFAKIKDELEQLVSSGDLTSPHGRTGFLPFLKYVDKTPRFKYCESEDKDEAGFHKTTVKRRPITFSGHFDSYLFSYYSYALNQIYINKLGDIGKSILAYRDDLQGKCNIQFAKEVFDELYLRIESKGAYSAIGLDITSYFDNIDHKRLKSQWLELIESDRLPADQYQVFKAITQYKYMNFESFRRYFNLSKWKLKNNLKNGSLLSLISDEHGSSLHTKIKYLASLDLITSNKKKSKKGWLPKSKGIPQGNPMSAVMSNLFLFEFDKRMSEKSNSENFVYRRYSDDILILCEPARVEELVSYTIKLIEKDFGLEINPAKAAVVHFERKGSINIGTEMPYDKVNHKFVKSKRSHGSASFQYLGFEFNGNDVLIRAKSVSRYYRKMKKAVYREIATYAQKRNTVDGFSTQILTQRFTHLGKRNFVTYAYKAARKTYNTRHGLVSGLNSPKIKRQLANHVQILNQEVESVLKVFSDRLGK